MNNNNAIEILKEFSEQLKTQEYDGNTTRIPTYWMIQKRVKIITTAESATGADFYLGIGYAKQYSDIDSLIEAITEKLRELDIDDDLFDACQSYLDNVEGLTNKEKFEALVEAISDIKYDFEENNVRFDENEWCISADWYTVVYRDIPNLMFLTKRDAKRYIENFGYRYSEEENPLRTYAYVADDSPDLKNLIDALKCIDWSQVRLDEAKVPDKTGDDDMDDYICPNCKSILCGMDWYDEAKPKFCEECGQKIDWN